MKPGTKGSVYTIFLASIGNYTAKNLSRFLSEGQIFLDREVFLLYICTVNANMQGEEYGPTTLYQ